MSYRRAGRLAVTDPPPIHTAQAATDTLHLARLQNTPAPSAHLTHSSSAVNLSQTHRPAPPTHTRRHTFGSGLTLLHCTISHSQPAAHAHAIARTAAPHARARPQTTAFSYSIPPSLFPPPPNGSCRQGGPGGRKVPEKWSLPPAAGSTSGL